MVTKRVAFHRILLLTSGVLSASLRFFSRDQSEGEAKERERIIGGTRSRDPWFYRERKRDGERDVQERTVASEAGGGVGPTETSSSCLISLSLTLSVKTGNWTRGNARECDGWRRRRRAGGVLDTRKIAGERMDGS